MKNKAYESTTEATLWSKNFTRDFMTVSVEMVAFLAQDRAYVVLTRPDERMMAIKFTPAEAERLGKALLAMHRRFQEYSDTEKDGEWLHK